jgi:5-formyltetrahydrofolate cyclo-ligase
MKSLPPSPHDKGALRRSLLDIRRNIGDEDRVRSNAAIGSLLDQRFQMHPVSTLGVFWPIRQEPDLLSLYDRLAARGIRLSLPVVVGKNLPLQFAVWSPGDATAKDSFGVPVPEHPVFVATPQALLIPCVGFNAQRFRLGYGAGFYDRTLAVTPRPFTIGIAYSCQQAVFDASAHDVALDMIVTETLIG